MAVRYCNGNGNTVPNSNSWGEFLSGRCPESVILLAEVIKSLIYSPTVCSAFVLNRDFCFLIHYNRMDGVSEPQCRLMYITWLNTMSYCRTTFIGCLQRGQVRWYIRIKLRKEHWGKQGEEGACSARDAVDPNPKKAANLGLNPSPRSARGFKETGDCPLCQGLLVLASPRKKGQ